MNKVYELIRLTGIVLLLLFHSCQNNEHDNKNSSNESVRYGGVFRVNEVSLFKSLFPLNTTDVISYRIISQVYEGLLKFSPQDLSITPNIAERWEVNETATSFIFYLRKGVKFHNDGCFKNAKGRDVTAYDFKYCFDKLCEANPDNNGYSVFKDNVVGANEYYESTKGNQPLPGGVKGVKVLDDYILKIDLNYPYASFYNVLCTPFCYVYPREAVEKYGPEMRVKCVGTGPFKLSTINEGEVVFLTRNPFYWKKDPLGNQLPYLDGIKITFINDKKAELIEFKKKNLDMVYRLPIEMIDEIMTELEDKENKNLDYDIQFTPALNIQYYGFLNSSELFKNKMIRQAFNYAIDREKIVNYVLKGKGIAASWGFVPPSFENYDFESIRGYHFEPDKARKLLAEAGYPNGEGFPEISLNLNNNGGPNSSNIRVAEIIRKMMMENLNIKLKLNIMPFPQHLNLLESGNALFWSQSWIADYPDPENFLKLFYGANLPSSINEKSYINTVRYKNPVFDSIFSIALKENDRRKRFDLLLKADQIALDDAAYMPLYYDEHCRLIRLNVRNFPSNAMEYRDFSIVYFSKDSI
jgi:peptide/nickel transport system substrate-binding protein